MWPPPPYRAIGYSYTYRILCFLGIARYRAIPPAFGGIAKLCSGGGVKRGGLGGGGYRKSYCCKSRLSGKVFVPNRTYLFFGTGTKGGISGISKISRFSRISRKWSDFPVFSTVWGSSRNSRISKFSRISRKNGLSWKDPFSKRPLFPNPIKVKCNWHDLS